MLGTSLDGRVGKSISLKLQGAFAALLEALEYADDAGASPWDFAVSIRHLKRLGLVENDLRWLVRKGYVQHRREVTVPGEDGRAFRSTGDLTFCRRTCLVLTEAGALKAHSLTDDQLETADAAEEPQAPNASIEQDPTPHWDAEKRELRIDGKMVKRFKWRAENQEIVLCAFQEEGWPSRIDDPLPPHAEQDSKRRLSDTIKCLNRKQTHELIHFRGDGTGEGVVWENVAKEDAK